MNTSIGRIDRRVLLVAFGIALPLAACKQQAAAAKDAPTLETVGSAATVVAHPTVMTDDSVEAQPANPDPCSFVPISDATRLLILSAKPFRATSADDRSPSDVGHACVYPLVAREGNKPSFIALELKTSGAMGFENGARVVSGMAKTLLKDLGAKSGDGSRYGEDRWDYLGNYTDVLTGRVGHIAIYAKWAREYGTYPGSFIDLIDIMRDRIPDRPFLSPEPNSSPADGDACSLLTRKEVESQMGKLVVPPYHSRDLTGLADRQGNACSYYTPNHHVFSVLPSWSNGKALFRVLRDVNNMVESTVGTAGFAVETVTGDWDQVAPTAAGDRMFLKGDRLVQVSYRMSTTTGKLTDPQFDPTNQAGAMYLASLAVKRLAAAP